MIHAIKQLEAYGKAGVHVADAMNELIFNGEFPEDKSLDIIDNLLVKKWAYVARSWNVSVSEIDAEKAFEQIVKWKGCDIVIVNHHPDLGIIVLNPKNPQHKEALESLRRNELIVVYAGYQGKKDADDLCEAATEKTIEVLSGKKVRVPDALLKGSFIYRKPNPGMLEPKDTEKTTEKSVKKETKKETAIVQSEKTPATAKKTESVGPMGIGGVTTNNREFYIGGATTRGRQFDIGGVLTSSQQFDIGGASTGDNFSLAEYNVAVASGAITPKKPIKKRVPVQASEPIKKSTSPTTGAPVSRESAVFAQAKQEQAAAAQAAAAQAARRSSQPASFRKVTPMVSVPVSNELFHNGNVEAWKRIIASYEHKYPNLHIFVYYDGERITDINSLFKWGKVKHGSNIQFVVAGDDIKDVAKLKRYFTQGASPHFEDFLQGAPGAILPLF